VHTGPDILAKPTANLSSPSSLGRQLPHNVPMF